MLFALDKNNNKVHIDDIDRKEDYFCPCCGSKLTLRLGNIRIHHFAHQSDSICNDGWHYDMTDWHYDWQNRFPKECQEVVKTNNGQIHRADVLIEEKKLVYEFQHSPMTPEEFNDRNTFYNGIGYKVIWIFDVQEQFDNERFIKNNNNSWNWKRAKNTFKNYYYKDNINEIFLEIFNGINTPEQNEDCNLLKVIWNIKGKGLSNFVSDVYIYGLEEMINLYDGKEICDGNEYKLHDLYDELIELDRDRDMTYYFGCPISTTHKCSKKGLNHLLPNYTSCVGCDYQNNDDIKFAENLKCIKRFVDLRINPNTIVRVESRDKYNFINKISYIKDGIRKFIDLPTFIPQFTKDIITLWKENKCTMATCKNLMTGKFVRITVNPEYQIKKYNKIYGYLSNNGYFFPNTSIELFGVLYPEWVMVWSK